MRFFRDKEIKDTRRNTMRLPIPMGIGVIKYNCRCENRRTYPGLSVFKKVETRQCGTAERQGLLRLFLSLFFFFWREPVGAGGGYTKKRGRENLK